MPDGGGGALMIRSDDMSSPKLMAERFQRDIKSPECKFEVTFRDHHVILRGPGIDNASRKCNEHYIILPVTSRSVIHMNGAHVYLDNAWFMMTTQMQAYQVVQNLQKMMERPTEEHQLLARIGDKMDLATTSFEKKSDD